MKKLRPFLLLCLLLAALSSAASAITLNIKNPSGTYETKSVTEVSLVCDGVALTSDIPAYISNQRTMVPVRIISEYLGASVTWKGDTQQVQIENRSTYITLTIGSADAVVNGQTVALYDGVPATMAAVGSLTRTMVPLRFVSEQLGASVSYDGASRTVFIETAKDPTYDISAPVFDGERLSIPADENIELNIFTLPSRVVIDFPCGVFTDSSSGSVPIGSEVVEKVRYNQFDTGYDVARVARVVLDLNEGYSIDDLIIEFTGGSVSVRTAELQDPVEAPLPDEDNTSPLIILDAGHGGTDTGAIYTYNEKDLVLPLTLAVGAILEDAGFRVEYTRTDDTYVSLAARTEQVNTQGADIFVSIHMNAFAQKPEVNGLETYYLVGGERAKTLAERIHAAVLASTGANDRSTRTANFYVLRNTEMPAVLVETGYMSNDEELALLATEEYRALLATGIANGIIDYFS